MVIGREAMERDTTPIKTEGGDGGEVEAVEEFYHLGSLIVSSGDHRC